MRKNETHKLEAHGEDAMKAHLSKARLLELGLDTTLAPTEEEHLHLEGCSECAKTLQEERAFTARLEASREELRDDLPRGFLSATQARFLEALDPTPARATSAARTLAWEIGLVLGLCFTLGALLLTFVVFPSLFVALVVAFARTLSTFQVILEVLAKTPALAAVTFVYASVTLVFCTGVVSRMLRSSRRRSKDTAG